MGISLSEWARAHGFSAPLVYQVLSGKRKGVRGESHRIAVALQLKDGSIGDLGDLFGEERGRGSPDSGQVGARDCPDEAAGLRR